MEDNTDYIDDNYVWQCRVRWAFRTQKTPVLFPYASELGTEFNPSFEREEKIDLALLNNGTMLDMYDFAKAVTKSEMYFLFEILDFNFDLGMTTDDPLCHAFALKIHTSARSLRTQSTGRPVHFFTKSSEIFALPETMHNPNPYVPQDSVFRSDLPRPHIDDRKGNPIFLKKSFGRTVRLTMDCFPLCKKLGVALVLQPANAPAQKLHTSLLTCGVVVEALDFAKILCGTTKLQILRDLISHNFGEVYDQMYVGMQMRSLAERKYFPTRELREAFRREPFQFMIRKRKPEKKKAPIDETDVDELLPVKRKSTLNLDEDYVWQDTEESYMCPVEFDSDFSHVETGEVNSEVEEIKEEQYEGEIGGEHANVNVETVLPEAMAIPAKPKEQYVPSKHTFRPKKPEKLSTEKIFSKDIYLSMDHKTLKQKEWTRRANRIKQILCKPGKMIDTFSRCKEICLDFNVGSGRRQQLDMTALTNHTLYEVNRFAVALSRSLGSLLLIFLKSNFNLSFENEQYQRNLMYFLINKERIVYLQSSNEVFLKTLIPFPEEYNMMDVTGDPDGDESSEPDIEVSDLTKAEFPYCTEIGLDLWSVDGRPSGKKLDLTVMTYGALLEVMTFGRRLCTKPFELVKDILEHNFDVDLEDSSTEDYIGLSKWFTVQKHMHKKTFWLIRANAWLTEVVNLKQYAKPQTKRKELKPPPVPPKPERTYDICKEIGLDLDVSSKSDGKQKLDLQLLTRAVLFEVHHFVETKCNRYVPTLYTILEYNFDLSSQKHRKVELAWSIAAQVLAMVRKKERKGDYMKQVFDLPLEMEDTEEDICKEEPEEETEAHDDDDDDVTFVQKLIPVDIDVEID